MSIRNLKAITGLPFTAEIEDITDQIPRKGTWEAYAKWKIVRGVYYWKDGTKTSSNVPNKSPVIIPSGFRPFEFDTSIDTIVVHHFASESSLQNNCLHYLNNTDQPSLPYHVVIDGNQLLQVNDLMSMTFHCGANNTHTIGISIRGNLQNRPMTERERELLYIGILSIKAAVPSIKYVKGHNEINKGTVCPCISMDVVRTDIERLELHLKSQIDPAKAKDEIIKASNQHFYLFNQYLKDTENQKWLEGQLLEIHKKMDELNLFFNR